MNHGHLLAFALGTIGISACTSDRPEPSERSQRVQSPVSGGCAASKSALLVYSDIEEDSATTDQSGLQFSLERRPNGWVGTFQEAAGELGKVRALSEVEVGPASHVSFILVKGSDTSRFNGQFTCDSLWGRWAPYPTVVVDPKTFKRVQE